MFADFDFCSHVTSVFHPEMDHVAFLREDRQQLLNEIVEWTNS
jgi:hypothetical protein